MNKKFPSVEEIRNKENLRKNMRILSTKRKKKEGEEKGKYYRF
jgi:hypothetical protein